MFAVVMFNFFSSRTVMFLLRQKTGSTKLKETNTKANCVTLTPFVFIGILSFGITQYSSQDGS
jgi:hypothetical protein